MVKCERPILTPTKPFLKTYFDPFTTPKKGNEEPKKSRGETIVPTKMPVRQVSQQSSASSGAAVQPGAYAMDLPAPVYAMGDESSSDEEEEEDNEQVNRDVEMDATVQMAVAAVAPTVLDAQVAVVPEKKKEKAGPCAGKRLWFLIAAVLMVLVVIVVVVAVVVSGGDDDEDDDPSVDGPSPSPTASPGSSQPEGCFATPRAIMSRLEGRNNFEEFLELEICAGSSLAVGLVDRFDPAAGTAPPIAVQSNMRLKCGENGRLEDHCTIRAGDTLLLNSFFMSQELAAANVIIEGITFESGSESLLELTNGGDITFRDCLFRVSTAVFFFVFFFVEGLASMRLFSLNASQSSFDGTPIIVDFEGHATDTSVTQTVTFSNCLFEDLTYSSIENENVAAIIAAYGPLNKVIFQGCVFRNNEILDQVSLG